MSSSNYFLGITFIFASVYFLTILMGNLLRRKRWKVVTRLQSIQEYGEEEKEIEPLNRPFSQRIIRPALYKCGEFIEGLTPSNISKSLKDKLAAAGYMNQRDIVNFLFIQAMLLFFFPLVMIFISMIITLKFEMIMLMGLLGFLIALMLPSLILNSKISARQNQIRKSLPDVMDLLVVSVEAGLSFDMAMLKVTEKIQGVLSEEFGNVLNEIRVGKIRRIALREMAERTGVDELITFAGAIVQADQLGVSVGNVLRVQADTIRTQRRQKVMEEAEKAPIKMLFPLVFCIFPAIFAVTLGPAVIQLLKAFASME